MARGSKAPAAPKRGNGGNKQKSAPVTKKAPAPKASSKKQQYVESESDDDEDENFMQFNGGGDRDSDEESENEVFDLKMKGSDDEDDDDEDDDDESDDDNEYLSEDEEEDDENNLQKLVDSLNPELRNKIRNKQSADDDEEDDDEDDDEEEGWGKKKNYWNGDTADLEIGQEFEDAVDEEEAAKELHQQKLKRMNKKDFRDDFDDDDEDGESSEDDDIETLKKLSAKKSQTKDKVAREIEAITLKEDGDLNLNDLEVEKISKDVSKMSKQQKLDLIAQNSPELLTIISELRERVEELQTRINPVKEMVAVLLEHTDNKTKKAIGVDDDLIDYLDVKQQLLLSYCLNVTFYLYMKSSGKSVRAHPVMRSLLRLRYCLEKMQGLDAKVKHQIDRLVKFTDQGVKAEDIRAGLLRPNLAAFLQDDDEEEGQTTTKKSKSDSKKKSKKMVDSDDEEDDDEEDDEEVDSDDYSDIDEDDVPLTKPKKTTTATTASSEIYRPKKMTSVHYPDDNERNKEKASKKLDKQREKLRNSELLAALNEEFGTTPLESSNNGLGTIDGDLKRIDDEEREKIAFEEERFMRHAITKKDKKALKRRTAEADRLDNFDDIGEFADLEELNKLSDAVGSANSMPKMSKKREAANPFMNASSSKALARAMQELAGSSGGRGGGDSDDDVDGAGDDDFGNGGGRKRRRAPDMNGDDDNDDGANVFDDFVSKKKDFLQKKKEHYTAEPRYGGYEESVDAEKGEKRAASYEIIKNRGLTPHRKKENRNPRVKKREKYEKAIIARKGQVREVVKGAASGYGGEMTGIKSQVARSRKL